MNIKVPRWLVVTIGATFSAYHVVLAITSLDQTRNHVPVIIAMVLYAAATILSLLPLGAVRMPVWMAAFNVAVVVTIATLVSGEIVYDQPGGPGYASWYVAAAGTLLTITSVRSRNTFAWIGVGFIIVQSAVVAGPNLMTLGLTGCVTWVAVSNVLNVALNKAAKDTARFASAEREAVDWQAAQEAHVHERQFRIGQTSAMALQMLGTIRDTGGELTEEQRQECLHLEGAIRDEIRGRRLLNDAVREEVMLARRRGATVTLLDEGGIDDLDDGELDRVLNRLAQAIHDTAADRVIARTVPEGSDIAVTVVGLRTDGDGQSSALGHHDDDDDDEIDLWLEIPRVEPSVAR